MKFSFKISVPFKQFPILVFKFIDLFCPISNNFAILLFRVALLNKLIQSINQLIVLLLQVLFGHLTVWDLLV